MQGDMQTATAFGSAGFWHVKDASLLMPLPKPSAKGVEFARRVLRRRIQIAINPFQDIARLIVVAMVDEGLRRCAASIPCIRKAWLASSRVLKATFCSGTPVSI
jgi:hypothetical protein